MHNKRTRRNYNTPPRERADPAIQEILENTREILKRQSFQSEDLQTIDENANIRMERIMSRYTDMLANVTKLTDRAAGLEAVLKALADTPNEREWKELNDKIIAASDQVQAAIDYGTPAEVPTEPPPVVEPPVEGGSTGGVGGSTGGAGSGETF